MTEIDMANLREEIIAALKSVDRDLTARHLADTRNAIYMSAVVIIGLLAWYLGI